MEERDRGDDVYVRIVDVQIQKMRIVADEMGRASVRGAEKRGDVVFVDGIMPEMENFYIDGFGEQGDLSQKRNGGGFIDPAFAKLQGVFRSDIPRNEKGELAPEPARDDFAVGAGS